MADFLKKLCDELLKIRTYLVKIGPARRRENISACNKKFTDANELCTQYNKYIEEISRVKAFKEPTENKLIDDLCERFNKIYLEIVVLCQTSKETSGSEMEKFNLKAALSLLPVMNDQEQVTTQLIDGIEYYSSILEEGSQRNLIEFVVKSRLSQSAKLRLESSYNNVTELVKAMRLHLLPKKSYTAMHSKLQHIKQQEKTISDFGQEIANLFVDLTISQSEGHSENYNVLKRVNEKLAIKCFADGLRNRRLSTIITARKFESLNEAIQSAVDEEITSPSTSTNVFMGQRHYHQYNRNYRGNNRFQHQEYRRGGFNRGNVNRNSYQSQNEPYRGNTGVWRRSTTGQRRSAPPQNRRGRFYNSRGNRQYKRGENVNVMDEKPEKNLELNTFFRD